MSRTVLQQPAGWTRPARAAALVLAMGLSSAMAFSQANNLCDEPGEAPDLLPAEITARVRWGRDGEITAFSFGASLCNLGTCWANWVASTADHPVVAQNLFRLKDGRFEQVGQSWVLHHFSALSQSLCSTACQPTDGTRLGVSCSTTDSASIYGYQARLGPRSEVNPATGVFPFPTDPIGRTGNLIHERLQVRDADLDPARNAGAFYFAEIQIVARDDASAGLAGNNTSYRPVTVGGIAPNFDLLLTGSTTRGRAAIEAWKASDPDVVLSAVDVPGDGRILVGSRAVPAPGGWLYEYAVQNLTSNRAVGSFTVPAPPGVSVTSAGFHDVDYHSGEPYSGADWDLAAGAGGLTWATEPHAQKPDANALRWGTLYNFRFRADTPPSPGAVALGLFLPGAPAAVQAAALTPSPCDGDGVCEPGETCASCPADCSPAAGRELQCANGQDDDCDGSADCADEDCCRDPACAEQDADGDTYSAICDCDDSHAGVWTAPGETGDLRLAASGGGTLLAWTAPLARGGIEVAYDVLRSPDPADFTGQAGCLPAADPSSETRADPLVPPAGGGLFYLVRARNGCPAGLGSLGAASNGHPRTGRSCP